VTPRDDRLRALVSRAGNPPPRMAERTGVEGDDGRSIAVRARSPRMVLAGAGAGSRVPADIQISPATPAAAMPINSRDVMSLGLRGECEADDAGSM
jgi:hypothetical protein